MLKDELKYIILVEYVIIQLYLSLPLSLSYELIPQCCEGHQKKKSGWQLISGE